jgi:hypothetical protein
VGHIVGLGGVRTVDRNGPVRCPPLEFELGQRQSAVQDVGVVRGLYVLVEHVGKQGWLGSVQVVDTSAVGDEPELLQLIHEVLEGGIDYVVEFGLDEAFDDPETVPVVCVPQVNTAPVIARLRYSQFSLKRPPGMTKVWFKGMRELSQATPLQRVDSLVFLMSCAQ